MCGRHFHFHYCEYTYCNLFSSLPFKELQCELINNYIVLFFFKLFWFLHLPQQKIRTEVISSCMGTE